MTKGDLMRVINSVPDSAEIYVMVEDVEWRLGSAETEYDGFCDPVYEIRLRTAPRTT